MSKSKAISNEKLMFLFKNRLGSFKNWPLKIPTEKMMAEAGYFHCPNGEELDLVQCYCCEKKLDSWESGDDPWTTHKKDCAFANEKKLETEMTIEEFTNIEKEIMIRKAIQVTEGRVAEFNKQVEDAKNELKSLCH
ncbi:BIRC5 (predicted) [Pycnogonum litorale]